MHSSCMASEVVDKYQSHCDILPHEFDAITRGRTQETRPCHARLDGSVEMVLCVVRS